MWDNKQLIYNSFFTILVLFAALRSKGPKAYAIKLNNSQLYGQELIFK